MSPNEPFVLAQNPVGIDSFCFHSIEMSSPLERTQRYTRRDSSSDKELLQFADEDQRYSQQERFGSGNLQSTAGSPPDGLDRESPAPGMDGRDTPDDGIEVVPSNTYGVQSLTDAGADGATPPVTTPTTSLPREKSSLSIPPLVNVARIAPKQQKKHLFSLEAAKDSRQHIWLMEHEVGKPAQMKIFTTVEELHAMTRAMFPSSPNEAKSSPREPATIESETDQERVDDHAGGDKRHRRHHSHQAFGHETPELDTLPRIQTMVGPDDIQSHWRRDSSDSSSSSSSSGDEKNNFSFASERRKKKDEMSSSSSSSSEDEITKTYWLDVQTSDLDVVNSIFGMFPIEDEDIQRCVEVEGVDQLNVCATGNYVAVNLQCKAVVPEDYAEKHHGSQEPVVKEKEIRRHYRPQHYLSTPGAAVCSMMVFEDWIITLHAVPFHGLSELIRKVQSHFGIRRKKGTRKTHRTPPATLMSTAWVCATLIDFVIVQSLPDPNPLLAEADACDEMALMTGVDDQLDMLQRIAMLRRRIGQEQTKLYQKEKMLQQFLAPDLRTTFVARQNRTAEVYARAQGQVARVGERLNAAREVMSHASGNLASNISLQMANASNEMNNKMKILSQVAAICLPLNIVTGMFGMNVTVPFQSEEYPDTIAPFFTLVAVMVLWFVVSLALTLYLGKRSAGSSGATKITEYGPVIPMN